MKKALKLLTCFLFFVAFTIVFNTLVAQSCITPSEMTAQVDTTTNVVDLISNLADLPRTIATTEHINLWFSSLTAFLLWGITFFSSRLPFLKNVTKTQQRAFASAGALLTLFLVGYWIVDIEVSFGFIVSFLIGSGKLIYFIYPTLIKQNLPTPKVPKSAEQIDSRIVK